VKSDLVVIAPPALVARRPGRSGQRYRDGVEDLGPPVAYVALEEGTPVYDRDGRRIGVVDHVLADFQLDIFEGLIIRTTPLPGRHVFADVDQIAQLHERGVLVSVAREQLHRPGERSAARRTAAGKSAANPLEARVRRAWDWINGRR
jgi:hypothetical protein